MLLEYPNAVAGETHLLDAAACAQQQQQQRSQESGVCGNSGLLAQDECGRFRPRSACCLHAHRPRCGSALLFFQTCLHEGAPVAPGCVKYMIRADVLFRRIHTPVAVHYDDRDPQTTKSASIPSYSEDSMADRSAFVLLQRAEATESQSLRVDTAVDRALGAANETIATVEAGERVKGKRMTSRGDEVCGASSSGTQHSSAAVDHAQNEGQLPSAATARALREAAFNKSAVVAAMFGGSIETAANAAVLWRTR